MTNGHTVSTVPTKICKQCECEAGLSFNNPDPLNNKGDYWSLVEKMMKHEGWIKFEVYAWGEYLKETGNEARTSKFPPWLLLSPKRFIDLVCEWLGRKDVQEAFGELVNDIIALVDSQRCVWTPEGEGWRTECGSYFLTRANFCPCCGKKIEVKEG